MRGVNVLGFILAEQRPDDRPNFGQYHYVHKVRSDALMQKGQGVPVEVISCGILYSDGEAIKGQNIYRISNLLLADIVFVHPVEGQDRMQSLAVDCIQHGSRAQASPQDAEFSGVYRDNDSIEKEHEQQAEEQANRDEREGVLPDIQFGSLAESGNPLAQSHASCSPEAELQTAPGLRSWAASMCEYCFFSMTKEWIGMPSAGLSGACPDRFSHPFAVQDDHHMEAMPSILTKEKSQKVKNEADRKGILEFTDGTCREL